MVRTIQPNVARRPATGFIESFKVHMPTDNPRKRRHTGRNAIAVRVLVVVVVGYEHDWIDDQFATFCSQPARIAAGHDKAVRPSIPACPKTSWIMSSADAQMK
jgi:hypothetical protein